MSDSQTWTIQRLLTWTADYLLRNQSDSPRLDSEVLLGSSLGCSRIDLYTRFDQVPNANELDRFRQLVKRRAAGEPVAYLVGQKEFFALPLAVSPDVLIPRPETELLVVETIDRARKWNAETPIAIADVGTGSGNIAISLARHLPTATIYAGDISAKALSIARKNAETLGVADRIEFLEGDLLQPIHHRGPLDIVVSNPPYIGTAERSGLPVSVVNYEPEIALFSTGAIGTEVIERLIHEALAALKPRGILLIEISPLISERVRGILNSQSGWTGIGIKKDLSGLDRIAIAQKASSN